MRIYLAVIGVALPLVTGQGCHGNRDVPTEATSQDFDAFDTGGRAGLVKARLPKTRLVVFRNHDEPAAPDPPAEIASHVKYLSPPLGEMSAYLTHIPDDGQLHPAIIWISGGFSNSIDNFFFESHDAANDQSASQFWKAGIVTMYPSRRGGNDNPGYREVCRGEVDDVLAALKFLKQQPGIDPDRIYLGGHSTGGTVVLLVAALTNEFASVFSFGPALSAVNYSDSYLPFDTDSDSEILPRSPCFYLDAIQTPTYVIEGQQDDGGKFELMQNGENFPLPSGSVRFTLVEGRDHFNVLAPVNEVIAKRLAESEAVPEFTSADFRSAFEP